MSEPDVIEQLSRYGAWVERHENVELRPVVTLTLDDPPTAAPTELTIAKRGVSSTILAAAVVAVLGLVGAGWLAGLSGSDPTASLAADPPGPLFVLPDEDSGLSIATGWAETFAPLDTVVEVAILGRTDGDTVNDVMVVAAATDQPQPVDGWEEVQTPTGVVIHQLDMEAWTAVARQSGRWWIQVMAGPDRFTEAVELLDRAAIGPEGGIDLPDDETDRILERISAPPGNELTATYLRVEAPTVGGSDIEVETASSPTALIIPGVLGAQLTATTVQGLPAWNIVRVDDDGEWNVLAWRATANRIVAVSGHAPIENVRVVAESLRAVPEEQWRAETGRVPD